MTFLARLKITGKEIDDSESLQKYIRAIFVIHERAFISPRTRISLDRSLMSSSPTKFDMTDPSVNDTRAMQHLNKYAGRCVNEPRQSACGKSCLKADKEKFQAMGREARFNAFRVMLLALTARPDTQNQLRRSSMMTIRTQHRTFYALRGNVLCRNCFAGVIQLHPASISKHVLQTSSTDTITPYKTLAFKRRKTILGAQTKNCSHVSWHV